MVYVFQNYTGKHQDRKYDIIAVQADSITSAEQCLKHVVFSYRYKLFSINKTTLRQYNFPCEVLAEISGPNYRRNY